MTILSTLPSAGRRRGRWRCCIFGIPFTIIALIGVILLIGIVKKNAILMIDFALKAERERRIGQPRGHFSRGDDALPPDHDDDDRRAARRAAAMLPLGEGSELRQPLGISIVGGLIVSRRRRARVSPRLVSRLNS